jgi:ankyrin repeat protein
MTSGKVTREGQTLDLNARANNWTCLHFAAAMGHLEVIEALLTSMHPLQINALTNENYTAVMLAAERGHLEVVKLLLGYGASIHLTNKDGKTAVFLAREKGFSEVAQLITEVSSLRREKAAGNPKLALKKQFFQAAEDGELDRIKHMLSLSINHLTRPDKDKDKESPDKDGKDNKEDIVTVSVAEKGLDNWTALHLAARKGHTDVVHYLLTFSASLPPGSEALYVDSPTKNGWTPLMLAADRGHVGVTELLLKLGANPYLETGAGKNVFQLATEASHSKVLKLLNAAVEADSNRFARLKKKQEDAKAEKEAKSGKPRSPGSPTPVASPSISSPITPVGSPGSGEAPKSASGEGEGSEPGEGQERSLVFLP